MADITNDVIIQSITGSVDAGGWQCRFLSLFDTDLVETNQNVQFTWRPVYGDNPPGPPLIAFDGWVLPTRFDVERGVGVAEFIAETSHAILRDQGWLQGIGFAEIDGNRAHYHQFSDNDVACPAEEMGHSMTSGKLVKHILGYYDTCTDIGPYWVAHTNMVYHAAHNPLGWINTDNVEISEWSAVNTDGSMAIGLKNVRETNNPWDRIREIANDEFFVAYFDKRDQFYYKKHPMYQAAALPTPVMTFGERFILAPLVVEDRSSKQIRQVKLHAVTDDGDVLHSEYPATITADYGRIEEMDTIRCNSQDVLDDWCERHYLWLNRDYTVTVQAAGAVGLLFELLDRVQMTYTGTAYNGVHIDWTGKKFWIHEIDVQPSELFGAVTTFVLEAENT